MGRNLIQASINTQGHIAANAAVTHDGFAQFLSPILPTFGKAVAQHHNIGGANGRFGLESTHPCVVIRWKGGRLVGYACSHGIGYLGAQTYHIRRVYGMNAVAKQNDGEVVNGVDNDRCARIARVSVSLGT